jgi:hypothetical protein
MRWLGAALLALSVTGTASAQSPEPDKVKQLEQELTGGGTRTWGPMGSVGAQKCVDGESYRFALPDHSVTIERCQSGRVADTRKASWVVEQRGPFMLRLKIREQEWEAEIAKAGERPTLKLKQAAMGGGFVRPIEKDLERVD